MAELTLDSRQEGPVTVLSPRGHINAHTVQAFEGRLQQICWNLLANAVKFTPRGGTITVRLVEDGSVLRLTVHDTGKGIDPNYLPRVFELFSQEDSSMSRAHEGIGLGLSIVRSLVELHGGTIHAASPGVGRGATFTVDLPVLEGAPGTVVASAAAAGTSSAVSELASLRGVRVLVVDDQQYARDLVVAIFRHAGAEVLSASSVREGLIALVSGSPDVVVCDVAMPEKDGFEFLRTLRALDAPANATPIIALTAFGRPEDRVRALKAGFDRYMKKPVDPAELAAAVRDLAPQR